MRGTEHGVRASSESDQFPYPHHSHVLNLQHCRPADAARAGLLRQRPAVGRQPRRRRPRPLRYDFRPRRSLDFSCRVGRLDIAPSPGGGDTIVGLDVSPVSARRRHTPTASAFRRAAERHVPHLRRRTVTTLQLFVPTSSTFSSIVFQHVPPKHGKCVLRRMRRSAGRRWRGDAASSPLRLLERDPRHTPRPDQASHQSPGIAAARHRHAQKHHRRHADGINPTDVWRLLVPFLQKITAAGAGSASAEASASATGMGSSDSCCTRRRPFDVEISPERPTRGLIHRCDARSSRRLAGTIASVRAQTIRTRTSCLRRQIKQQARIELGR